MIAESKEPISGPRIEGKYGINLQAISGEIAEINRLLSKHLSIPKMIVNPHRTGYRIDKERFSLSWV